jgi:hypothetical protein
VSASVAVFWWLVGIFVLMLLGITAPGGSDAAFYSIAIAVILGAWLEHRYDPRGALR